MTPLDQVPTKIQLVSSMGIATNAFAMFLIKLVRRLTDITPTAFAVSGDYTIPPTSMSALIDASLTPITITLPPISATGLIIGVTKIDNTANTVTIISGGSALICGESSQVLLLRNEVLNFISDGTNWQLAN